MPTSQARYREQVAFVSHISQARPRRGRFRGGLVGAGTGIPVLMPGDHRGYDVAAVYSETNGVGGPATEALEDVLGSRVRRVVTTQESKERAFGRLLDMLSGGQLLLPDHPDLLRELGGLEATGTANGGLRIAAAGSGHDDLAMSLAFCAEALSADMSVGPATNDDVNQEWLRTPSGLLVPEFPRPRWGGMGSESAYARSS